MTLDLITKPMFNGYQTANLASSLLSGEGNVYICRRLLPNFDAVHMGFEFERFEFPIMQR